VEKGAFHILRYAQVWEDADILLEALAAGPGDTCLSIGSAGDNALSLLATGADRVIALDLNPAQIACLELRVAAFRILDHGGLLELTGSRPSARRGELYRAVRPLLSPAAAAFWDSRSADVARGVGGAGKFENYFRIFRERVLPLVHSRRMVLRLLEPRTASARETFYNDEWDTARWRALFRVFFSRTVMGLLGRDPSFFAYVEGSVADRIFVRTRHALTALDPGENPYLQWILTGSHPRALPFALRPENFERIRSRLDRFEWHCVSIGEYFSRPDAVRPSRFNLSDIFEYLSPDESGHLLGRLADHAPPGARLAYWNMLAPRSRPASLAHRIRPLPELAARLHLADKAFFYSAFVVEEIQ